MQKNRQPQLPVIFVLIPKSVGVHALDGHGLQGGHYLGLVGGIGHAVPLIGRAKHLDGGLLLIQQS